MRLTRSVRLRVAVGAAAVATLLVPVGPALANVGAMASMTVPSAAAVGGTGNGSFTITNVNTPPNQAESQTVTSAQLAPACQVASTTSAVCPSPEPGVFSVDSPAFGVAGTACAGVTFNVSAPDGSGAVAFAPTSTVVLAPPGGAAGSNQCTVGFVLRALKVPVVDVNAAPGIQTFTNFKAMVTSSPSGLQPIVTASLQVTVNRAVSSISTQASPSVTVGHNISDSATVNGVPGIARPTGTVTFSVYGPGDTTCVSPLPSSTAALTPASATSSTAASVPFRAAVAGTYRFVAAYAGDANYLPVVGACNAANESVLVIRPAAGDFNGNRTTDIAVFRPSDGGWYIQGQPGAIFGTATDIPVPGDYNGDGVTDIAVFRPSNGGWYIQGQPGAIFGTATDIPVPGDYNGDGITDIAVFRPSNGGWYIQGQPGAVFGTSGDIPVPGDYNGDAITDLAVFRPGTNAAWYVQGQAGAFFGTSGDVPVPGDYNGNGVTDIAVFRPSNGAWYVRNLAGAVFGTSGDTPAPGDYNGDGVTDFAVFRPSDSAWYVQGQAGTVFGAPGDIPV